MSGQETDEIQHLSTSVARQEQRLSGVENAVASMAADFKSFTQSFNTSRETNWPMLISIAGLVLVIIGGLWQIVDLKSQVALSPIQAQNAISVIERGELRREISGHSGLISDEISHRKEALSALQQQLVEAETQHRTRDIVGAKDYENVMSHIRVLYASMKLPTPDSPSFHPSIGREISTPIPNN